MTKVLNINALAKERQELAIDGKTYLMKQMSVVEFIELTERAEKIEKSKGHSLSTHIELLVETIGVSFPDCPEDVLKSRTLEELNAIFEFARDGVIPSEAQIEQDDAIPNEAVESEPKKIEAQS